MCRCAHEERCKKYLGVSSRQLLRLNIFESSFQLNAHVFFQCTKPHQAHCNHHFWIKIFRRIFNLIALYNNLIVSRKKIWADIVVTGFTLIFCICGRSQKNGDNFVTIFLFFKCVVSHIILSQSCHNMS